MSEPDLTDDWMNPQSFASWSPPPRCDDPSKVEYLIERARAIPVSGNVSHITEWRHWSTHETAAERDAAMEKLSEEHPMWMLRPRSRWPYYEDRNMPSPGSGPHPGINP